MNFSKTFRNFKQIVTKQTTNLSMAKNIGEAITSRRSVHEGRRICRSKNLSAVGQHTWEWGPRRRVKIYQGVEVKNRKGDLREKRDTEGYIH